MKMWMAALAMASALTVQPAWALSPGEMTVAKFRTLDHTRQVAMVFGAMAITDVSGIVCKQTVTVGELVAGLTTRQLDLERPWAEVMMSLMDERGCGGQQQAKGDA